MTLSKKRPVKSVVALFAVLVVTATVAGCLDDEDDDTPDRGFGAGGGDGGDSRRGPDSGERQSPPGNRSAPGSDDPPAEPRPAEVEANLQVDSADGWVGDNFTFDGRASIVRNGSAVEWTFDFGDDESENLTAGDDPVVEHNYTAGGTYTVNLTLVAEGEDGRQVEDSTNLTVSVHERLEVPETEVDAGVLGGSEEHPFETKQHALNFTVHLQLEHTATSVESSDGTVRVLDPEREVVAEQEFGLSSGEAENVTLEGGLNATGEHILEVEAESGSVQYHGTLYVVYRVLD